LPSQHFLPKQNLLIVGPTGSGKTLAISKLAKMYSLDVGICNAADFTAPGWKGRDPEEAIKEVYIACDRNIGRTEKAIVVLDEVDKMVLHKQHSSTGDASSAENSFLKIIEGTDVTFEVGQGTVTINTSNILFIAAGAFEGIEDFVRKRIGRSRSKQIGFLSDQESAEEDSDFLYQQINNDDLIAYGIGAQFLGRFSDTVCLRKLTEEDLKEILLRSDSSMIQGLDKILFASNHIRVKIDEAGAGAIAHQAVEKNVGARGLSHLITPLMQEKLFEMDDTKKYMTLKLSANEDNVPTVEWLEEDYYPVLNTNVYEPIRCAPKTNRVENFVDYILSGAEGIVYANVREIRAAHALLCSVVFYLLLECNKFDQTLESIDKLLRHVAFSSDLSEDGTVYLILMEDGEKNMQYHFYYDKFITLDPSKKSARLAVDGIRAFIENPVYMFL